MASFKNLKIWRQRLPHWRADDVTYFVTFRHKRSLDERERAVLKHSLLQQDGKKWDLLLLCVLPDRTDLLAQVRPLTANSELHYELSKIVEVAKSKTEKKIGNDTWAKGAFYGESYDRIVRDDLEMEERWNEISEAPAVNGLVAQGQLYDGLWTGTYTFEAESRG